MVACIYFKKKKAELRKQPKNVPHHSVSFSAMWNPTFIPVSSYRWWCFHIQLNCNTQVAVVPDIHHNKSNLTKTHETQNPHSGSVDASYKKLNFLLQLLKACPLRWKSHTCTTHTLGFVCVVTWSGDHRKSSFVYRT